MTNNTKYLELAEIVSEQYGVETEEVLEYAKMTEILNNNTEPTSITQYCEEAIYYYEQDNLTDEVFYKTINKIIACMPEDEKHLKETRRYREARDQSMREELFPLAM